MILSSALLVLLLPGIAQAYNLLDLFPREVQDAAKQREEDSPTARREAPSKRMNPHRDDRHLLDESVLPLTPAESTLSTGLFHTCAIAYRAGVDQGTCGGLPCGPVRCWGHNDHGQSGAPPGMFWQVSAGGFFTCGIKAGGKAVCWGDIDHPPKSLEALTSAELSDVKHARRMQQAAAGYTGPTSQTVTGDDYYVSISSGNKHACAIARDKQVSCWGRNDYGESTPPSGSFSQVSAGNAFTCGIRPNGEVECWGKNEAGQSAPPSYPENAFLQISAR